MRICAFVLSIVAGALLPGGFALAEGAIKETADVVGQGGAGPLVSAQGAQLIRTESGINISLTMPTPQSGMYVYPDPNPFQAEVVQGHPEVFTGWAFIFNWPDQCSDGECGFDDLGPNAPARGGAFNFAGHIVGGPTLRMSGRVDLGDPPFPAAPGVPLENPRGAEVHVAIAPHGEVQPDLLPTQITTPIGTADHWWQAIFK
jgi:hypothetical protein